MELKLNSISTRLYLWFYTILPSELPQSLCPYFWKLLWMIFLIIPYTLLGLPAHIYYRNENIKWDRTKSLDKLSFGLFGYVGLIFLGSILIYFIGFFMSYEPKSILFNFSNLGETISILLGILSILGLICWGIFYINDNSSINNSIPITFIKAKYNKYCPRITFK